MTRAMKKIRDWGWATVLTAGGLAMLGVSMSAADEPCQTTCNGEPIPPGMQCCYDSPDASSDSGSLFDPSTGSCCACNCASSMSYVSSTALDQPRASRPAEPWLEQPIYAAGFDQPVAVKSKTVAPAASVK